MCISLHVNWRLGGHINIISEPTESDKSYLSDTKTALCTVLYVDGQSKRGDFMESKYSYRLFDINPNQLNPITTPFRSLTLSGT